jgi:CO dehydrogenase/acetyl-CoA synthase beta subunit
MSIEKLRAYLEIIRKREVQYKEILCPRDAGRLLAGLSFRIDHQSDANIILKEDTFVELGPPDRASCSFVLMSTNPGLLNDGSVTLAGPDIQNPAAKTLPIGQALLVAGKALKDEHYRALEQCQYISNRLPGYMIRTVPGRMWSRVSKTAAQRGFCVEILARNLMALYKSTFPLIEAMEVVFITSCDSDVSELRNALESSQKTALQILNERYGCNYPLDCNECPYKPVCDQIRKMVNNYEIRNEESDQRI